jgi:hypothetical protein
MQKLLKFDSTMSSLTQRFVLKLSLFLLIAGKFGLVSLWLTASFPGFFITPSQQEHLAF